MKLFWKFFFATMVVSVTCMALGGYLLINSNIKSLLNSEAQMVQDYGDMVYYSLTNELKTTKLSLPYLEIEGEEDTRETIKNIASSISINNANQKVTFGIISDSGQAVFSSLTKEMDKDMVLLLEDKQRGWVLKRTSQSSYVQGMRPISYQGNTFYIETVRDVTHIFNNQKLQYETLLKIMVGMLFLAGLVTLILSKLLIRKIISLSEVTKDISGGDLTKRAIVTGGDEITMLSENFNKMADILEEKMLALQEEANKKELFVGAFSHELKTPLTSIIGYSDMLRRKDMDKNQRRICAEYIFSEGKRLEHLSMRLMDLIVLNKQELYLVSTDMPGYLKGIAAVFLPQLSQLGITLSSDIEEAVLPLDQDLMKTVIINMIDNAKKAIGQNGQIGISGKWLHDYYLLSISDTGKGMEQKEISKINQAFYMVDKSRSRENGGVGLGLAICDKIINLHGYQMDFESRVNAGTVVKITMGRAKDE